MLNNINNSKRLMWPDALKGMAILIVLFGHSGAQSDSDAISLIFRMIYSGFEMFFIITGFFAYSSAEHFFAKNDFNFKNLCKWWGKKFQRLIPVYYVALVVYFIYNRGMMVISASDAPMHVSIGNILMHLLLLHGLFPTYCCTIVSVEWYVGILVLFYLIIPFVYYFVKNIQGAFAFLICTYGANVLANRFVMSFIIPNNNGMLYVSFFTRFWIFAHMPTFALGVLLYYLSKRDYSELKYPKAYSLMLILFVIVMDYGQAAGVNTLAGWNDYTVEAIWFTILIYSQILWSNPIICNRFFGFLGRYSYPMYLFHILIYHLYDSYIHIGIENGVALYFIRFVAVLVVTVLISVALTKFIDDPMQKVISGFFEKRRANE